MSIIKPLTNNDGETIDVVDVPVIDYAKLLADESNNAKKLLDAANSDGFIQLDLTTCPEGRSILERVQPMYSLGYRYFEQPEHEKEKDNRGEIAGVDRGYKSCPSDETYEISRDEFRAGNPAMPAVFEKERTLLETFNEGCHKALCKMVDSLSASLGRVDQSSLDKYHKDDMSSESGLKFVNEPTIARRSEVVENLHTDGGTFTLLFSKEWGLHAYLPSQQRWAFVPPRDGCALISVADSLSKLSGSFHSPQHRVAQCENGAGPRMYLSYFLRPSHAMKGSIFA